MLKKLVLGFIAFILVFTLLPQKNTQAAGFSDVTKYKEEINYLSSEGIINGYQDGTFKPAANLTRLQAVTMILREKDITDFTAPDPGFTDLKKGNHGYEIIAKAVQLGIISGKTNENGKKYFDAGAPLTRGQMSKILVEGYKLPKTKDVQFKDVSIKNGFRDYISVLATKNITTGYLDGTFRPNNKISREHFAVFMARMLNDKFKPGNKPSPEPSLKDLKVHFIDVGQGDSTLIQTAAGENILIDAGIQSAGEKVVSFLKSKDVGKLDLVIATHAHADHIGGLIPVLNEFVVTKFIDGGNVHTTQTYLELLTLIDTKDIAFEIPSIGQVYNFENAFKMTVLNVDSNTVSLNDASVALKAEYNKVSFMLTGDAEMTAEKNMVNSNYNLKSTIYKAGHHGSNSSSTPAFLNKVKPEATILSYGEGNSYGHPHKEVIERLQSMGSKIYSTANSGDITVTTNGISYSISAKPWTPPTVTPKPDPKPDPGITYPININKANYEQLQHITGVGPVIAERIIEYRKKSPFTSKDQIKNVKGIGEATYQKMKNEISV